MKMHGAGMWERASRQSFPRGNVFVLAAWFPRREPAFSALIPVVGQIPVRITETKVSHARTPHLRPALLPALLRTYS